LPVAGAYFGAYLKRRAKTATHEDIKKVLVRSAPQLKRLRNEARISDEVWDRQKRWDSAAKFF